MTPSARISAAITILDRINAGEAAEKALTNWARASRFAGSGDRAAIRDLVFDVLRTWRSSAAVGGGDSGRARMLGHLRQTGRDAQMLFDGSRHGPQPLSAEELSAGRDPEGAEALDLPDWLAAAFSQSLGDRAEEAALAQRQRAPVFLRVNLARVSRDEAAQRLADEGIGTEPHPEVETALRVVSGARGIVRSDAYSQGLIELQDASSQAVVAALPLADGMRILDYCAGGGGKTLAVAARMGGRIEAHDADPRRMADLPARAARAGADVRLVEAPKGPYDLVLCDVPCSGSGAFRRSPEGKWRLTSDRLNDLCRIQSEILENARSLVGPKGKIAYLTCSVLKPENSDQAEAFCQKHPEWSITGQGAFLPTDRGDGFYFAIFERA